jgi:hypothetical protein
MTAPRKGTTPEAMPQLRHRSHAPYRVHYSPQAWREVGRMSAETFLALQDVLERLGDPAYRGPEAAPGEPIRHMLSGHALVLEYTWEERSRTLTLLALERVPRRA